MHASLKGAARRSYRGLAVWERRIMAAAGVVLVLIAIVMLTSPVLFRETTPATVPLVLVVGLLYLAAIPLTLVAGFSVLRWLIGFWVYSFFPSTIVTDKTLSSTSILRLGSREWK